MNIDEKLIYAISITFAICAVIFLIIIYLIKRPKKWKPKQIYVFAGVKNSKTIFLLKLTELKKPEPNKTHKYTQGLYSKRGINVKELKMGRIYSFEKREITNTNNNTSYFKVIVTGFNSNNNEDIDNTVPFYLPKTGSDSI